MDIKVAQELFRHANAKITLDLYTQAISSQSGKRTRWSWR
jgi:hypothetical protein